MDEKLQQELAEWMAGIRGTAEQASTVVAEQGPEVAAEVVAFGRARMTAYVGLSLILIVIGTILIRRVLAAIRRATNAALLSPVRSAAEAEAMICGMIAVAILTVGTIAFGTNINPALEAWFAPRLYIIHEIARLVGGNN